MTWPMEASGSELFARYAGRGSEITARDPFDDDKEEDLENGEYDEDDDELDEDDEDEDDDEFEDDDDYDDDDEEEDEEEDEEL